MTELSWQYRSIALVDEATDRIATAPLRERFLGLVDTLQCTETQAAHHLARYLGWTEQKIVNGFGRHDDRAYAAAKSVLIALGVHYQPKTGLPKAHVNALLGLRLAFVLELAHDKARAPAVAA